MPKRILIFLIAALMSFTAPAYVMAAEAESPFVEQGVEDDVTISVNGQWVYINGAQGQVLEVVSLTGRRVMTIKIESPSQRVELNIPKGCYILKIGKVVRKVAIR